MSYLEAKVMEDFVVGKWFNQHPKMIAILLGGSVVYRYANSGDPLSAPDWDGALLMATKRDIFDLVNGNRRTLLDMFEISREEWPQLRVPHPSDQAWHDFDAVRFVGYTRSGLRKSVKILSMQYFSESRNSLNLLSFKDRRIFESYSTESGLTRYRVHQATDLEDGLLLLHDQWLFSADSTFCEHGRNVAYTTFGVTADLLLTGVWIYGKDTGTQLVQKRIMQHYVAETNSHATLDNFARSHRFDRKYRQWLSNRLEALNSLIPLPPFRCLCESRGGTFLYGTHTGVSSNLSPDPRRRVKSLPLDISGIRIDQRFLKARSRVHEDFSSNSVNGPLIVETGLAACPNMVLFCKSSQFQQFEIRGAQQAALFYPTTQEPVLAVSGELLYPFFQGRTEAEHRLSFVQGNRSDWPTAEIILHAELQKAEDMLRAYRQSFQIPPLITSTSPEWPIQRFYYARLLDNARFTEFYKAGIKIKDEILPVFNFCSFQLRVNNQTYPSLDRIAQTAAAILHPNALASGPIVFGLGDAHGANIMIGDVRQANNSHETVYIDYEVAGYHSPLLDLAKPFHHDTFFEMLYADKTEERGSPDVQYYLEGNTVVINVKACTDELSKAILNIKRRYLIDPLFDFAKSMSCDLDSYTPQLASALFACSVLTRNYSGKWDTFFANVAVGAVLSQAQCLEEIWAACDSLTGQHEHENRT